MELFVFEVTARERMSDRRVSASANYFANSSNHWGRGDLETSGNILGKLWALDRFSPNVSTNHILGTSRLRSQHVPSM